MADIDEIINYIKSLKKGFDKNLFQNKIDELAYAVENIGLQYDDFHILFKVWLNLSIPITKWVSLGSCLVPPDMVEQHTFDYALCWILTNYEDQSSFSRIAFLLDWLTVAMECNCINMEALDTGYEVFYVSLQYENLTPHAMKLIYTLTKPYDITRRRVLDLFDIIKTRDGKKNMYRQLQVLLGLFKSYKPELVPEYVPAISIHTAFKKLNINLLERFKKTQDRRKILGKEKHQLLWTKTIIPERGRNKKADPLVPHMEFINVGSQQYASKEPLKNYLDFTDPVEVVQHDVQTASCRPARLRALLCNDMGLTLLAVASRAEHAFFSHDLQHLLSSCFLYTSPHSYMEKQDLLSRLALLQNTLLQGIPVITRFLAQYLPLWNEKDYFAEILELVEWVSVDSPDHMACILETLAKTYQRAQPIEQCAILKSVTNMYSNLVYSSTRNRQHYMGINLSSENYYPVIHIVATAISGMCNKALQVNPDDMRVLYSSVWSAECACRTELCAGVSPATEPAPLVLSLPMLSVSAALIDKMAVLMILYKKIFARIQSTDKLQAGNRLHSKRMQMLQSYTSDMVNCLYSEQALSARNTGLVFEKLPHQLASKLISLMPDVDSKLSIRNHLAFLAYTGIELDAMNNRYVDNKLMYRALIDQEFVNLSKFLKTVIPELRYQ